MVAELFITAWPKILSCNFIKNRSMQSYVLMLHADEDDRQLTQSIVDEMQAGARIVYLDHLAAIPSLLNSSGNPAVILVNNFDHLHAAIETVKKLKTDPLTDHVPVVVLGEITTPDYIRKYYRAGANSYIVKPSTIAGTRKKIKLFFEYWLAVAEV